MKRDSYLTIRIPKRKRATYEAAAEADGRTLTGWVERNLDRAVDRAARPGRLTVGQERPYRRT